MEVPVHELPIETVIVGDEPRLAVRNAREPVAKADHDVFRLVEGKGLLAGETADR